MVSDLQRKILRAAVEHWNAEFCGISAINLADQVGESHEIVLKALEAMSDEGAGNLNRNVTLRSMCLAIELESQVARSEFNETQTHFFFPCRAILKEYYFKSDLVRKNLPEYKVRLHQGGQPLDIFYFSFEALARYTSRPDLFETYDTQAGGAIFSKNAASDSQYVYVRYGKRLLSNGEASIVVILRDLGGMSDEQQRYWHSHELDNATFMANDSEFRTFVGWTFDGEWGDSVNIFEQLQSALQAVSKVFSSSLFRKIENPHLRLPADNTTKEFCDCCSELFKLIGPDNIDAAALKAFLIEYAGESSENFIHKESRRPLSTAQLLALIEKKLSTESNLSIVIEKVKEHRVNADHRILSSDLCANSLKMFSDLIQEVSNSLNLFEKAILNLKGGKDNN